MSQLKDRLRADMTAAMKARESERLGTLRMALTAITTAEVAGSDARDLSDDEVLDVLDKEVKKRRESAQTYDEAGRSELAAKERAEAEILGAYLPAALTDAELDGIITAAIVETGAEGPRDMGKVMKLVQPQTKGKADGSAVAAAVKARLT